MTKTPELSPEQFGKAWAWLCDFGICSWAYPTKEKLLEENKPSPEAKPIHIVMLPIETKSAKVRDRREVKCIHCDVILTRHSNWKSDPICPLCNDIMVKI